MRRRISIRRCVRPSVRRFVGPSVPRYFQTHTRRILCRVSGLVFLASTLAFIMAMKTAVDHHQKTTSYSHVGVVIRQACRQARASVCVSVTVGERGGSLLLTLSPLCPRGHAWVGDFFSFFTSPELVSIMFIKLVKIGSWAE